MVAVIGELHAVIKATRANQEKMTAEIGVSLDNIEAIRDKIEAKIDTAASNGREAIGGY